MNSEVSPTSSKTIPWLKLLLLLGLVGLFLFLRNQYADEFSLEALAGQEATFKSYLTANPVGAVVIAFLIYVTVTALSLPAAAALTLGMGWIFGFWQGMLIVSFASTLGATLAFLFSRFLFKEAMLVRFGARLNRFNEALEREGAFYLFTLRLIPAVPFFVINVVMGLTPMKTRTFYWVSQLGMLPGTMAYVYAGSSVFSLETLAVASKEGRLFSAVMPPRFILAFTILAVLPWLLKKGLELYRRTPKVNKDQQEQQHDGNA